MTREFGCLYTPKVAKISLPLYNISLILSFSFFPYCIFRFRWPGPKQGLPLHCWTAPDLSPTSRGCSCVSKRGFPFSSRVPCRLRLCWAQELAVSHWNTSNKCSGSQRSTSWRTAAASSTGMRSKKNFREWKDLPKLGQETSIDCEQFESVFY